jgi:hypothetical protein
MVQELMFHFDLPLRYLRYFGLWQRENSSKSTKFWGFVSTSVFVALTFALPIVNLANADKYYIDAVSFILIFLGGNLKIAVLFSRMEKFVKMIDSLKDLLEFSKFDLDLDRMKLKKHGRFMARLFMGFLGTLIFIGMTDLSKPLLENRLPFKTWIPYNQKIDDPRKLWALSLLQVFAIMVTDAVAVSLEMLPVLCMGIASVMLDELSFRMLKLSENQTTDEEDHKELVKCIETHQRISHFVRSIEELFSVTIFIQGFFFSAYICVSIFILSLVSPRILMCHFLRLFSCPRRFPHSTNSRFSSNTSPFFCQFSSSFSCHLTMATKSSWSPLS